MVSDHDIGRKEIERDELIPFLEAREAVTGEVLSQIFDLWVESPDFICARPDGALVGIELTKVTENHDLAFWDRVRYGEVHIDVYKTLETIQYLIGKKDGLRAARYTKKVGDNILTLQLVDGSLDQLRGAFDGFQHDYTSHGFSEIWLADYSGLGAYGDIELFGLSPRQWWGHHRRPWPDRKPYG